MNDYYVYIMTNQNNAVLYVGVTNNIERRVSEHKSGMFAGFTKRYNTHKLVYYEVTNDINTAIKREKQIKKWRRDKKESLISAFNPQWEEIQL